MKLITEYTESSLECIVEKNDAGEKQYKIQGIFAQTDKKNRNGRVYPKAIMEKAVAAAGELVHDDYKMFSHLKGEYVHMGKAGMVEAVSKGMMSPAKYRILFENDEIGFDHAYVTYQDGNTEALMCCWKFKDGKIIEVETGATKIPK